MRSAGSVLRAGGDRNRLARGDAIGAKGLGELLGRLAVSDLAASEDSPKAAELILGGLPAERLEAGLGVGLHEGVLGLAHALGAHALVGVRELDPVLLGLVHDAGRALRRPAHIGDEVGEAFFVKASELVRELLAAGLARRRLGERCRRDRADGDAGEKNGKGRQPCGTARASLLPAFGLLCAHATRPRCGGATLDDGLEFALGRPGGETRQSGLRMIEEVMSSSSVSGWAGAGSVSSP